MDDYIYVENKLTESLDDAFDYALIHNLTQVFNINSLTGSGVTSIVNAWSKHHNHNLIRIDAPLLKLNKYEIEELDFGYKKGVYLVGKIEEPKVIKTQIPYIFDSKVIDSLDEPNKVVFIDDYDYASYSVRKELLKFICHSQVVDLRESEHNFIKTINNAILIIVRIHPFSDMSEPLDEFERKIFNINDCCDEKNNALTSDLKLIGNSKKEQILEAIERLNKAAKSEIQLECIKENEEDELIILNLKEIKGGNPCFYSATIDLEDLFLDSSELDNYTKVSDSAEIKTKIILRIAWKIKEAREKTSADK